MQYIIVITSSSVRGKDNFAVQVSSSTAGLINYEILKKKK